VCLTKHICGSGCIDHVFWSSTLDGCESSHSRPDHFSPEKRARDNKWTEFWVEPKKFWMERNSEYSWLFQDSNSEPSIVQFILRRYYRLTCVLNSSVCYLRLPWLWKLTLQSSGLWHSTVRYSMTFCGGRPASTSRELGKQQHQFYCVLLRCLYRQTSGSLLS
jgi:hypothetical protein